MSSGPQCHLVFVYGTLKQGQPNHHYLQDKTLGEATLQGAARTVDRWPLVIGSKFNIPFLLPKRGHGKKIIGEVYRINDKMLSFLDDFESYPSLYTWEIIKVHAIAEPFKEGCKDGSSTEEIVQLECLCYIFSKLDAKLLEQPFLENYDSWGEHNRPYLTDRDDLSDPDDVWKS